MRDKGFLFILITLILVIFTACAYSATNQADINQNLSTVENTNSSLLEGCCSVAYQLEGNDSMIAFRRDAEYSANIKIENISWHGKTAIKQYKEEGGYFCQVIVTNDGWVIGFGGLDDGPNSKKIENLTANMVLNNSISNKTLEQIQQIKAPYEKGHVLIKAPNGTYGAALPTTHFTGVLKPGDYISVPNKYSFVRTGTIPLNTSDKVKAMTQAAANDGYGVSRRDITTYYFHSVENNTFKGNITNIFLSNDDGSAWGMSTGGLADNVFFNGTLFNASSIPIAPNYTSIGSINFTDSEQSGDGGLFTIIMHAIAFILFIVVICLIIRLINKIRYAKRRR